jgi:hypothetical protein
MLPFLAVAIIIKISLSAHSFYLRAIFDRIWIDFWKHPDPVQDLIKFSAMFLQDFFFGENMLYALLYALHTLKRLIYGHLLRPGSGSGSGLRRLDWDPTGSGSVTLHKTNRKPFAVEQELLQSWRAYLSIRISSYNTVKYNTNKQI